MKRKGKCFRCEHLKQVKNSTYIGFCTMHIINVPDSLCGCEKRYDGTYILHCFPTECKNGVVPMETNSSNDMEAIMENLTTTIEWHLAEKELPEKSGEYLTVQPYGGVRSLFFSAEHEKFNTLDHMDSELAEERAIRCVYWAEIPDCFTWENLAKFREE